MSVSSRPSWTIQKVPGQGQPEQRVRHCFRGGKFKGFKYHSGRMLAQVWPLALQGGKTLLKILARWDSFISPSYQRSSWVWRYIPLTQALRRQRQMHFCEFKLSLVQIMSSRTARATQRDSVSNNQPTTNNNNNKKIRRGIIEAWAFRQAWAVQ